MIAHLWQTTFEDLDSKSDDEAGITRSRDYLNSLIETERKDTGVPTSRMILGGFSQGGAMSIFTAVTTPHQMAGFVGMSSYLLMGKKAPSLIPASNPNAETPIWMGHGEADPLVKCEWGKRTADALKALGRKVDFKTYSGLEHSADPREISDLETFISQRLPSIEGDGAAASSSSSKA